MKAKWQLKFILELAWIQNNTATSQLASASLLDGSTALGHCSPLLLTHNWKKGSKKGNTKNAMCLLCTTFSLKEKRKSSQKLVMWQIFFIVWWAFKCKNKNRNVIWHIRHIHTYFKQRQHIQGTQGQTYSDRARFKTAIFHLKFKVYQYIDKW